MFSTKEEPRKKSNLVHNWKGGTYSADKRVRILKSDHPRAAQNGYVRQSILLAEKVLGKSLPPGVVVHHANGNQSIDEGNLVICENVGYHHLLHQRKRAYESCGNASWRKCNHCKKYDNPKNLYIAPKKHAHHHSCSREYQRNRKAKWRKNELDDPGRM